MGHDGELVNGHMAEPVWVPPPRVPVGYRWWTGQVEGDCGMLEGRGTGAEPWLECEGTNVWSLKHTHTYTRHSFFPSLSLSLKHTTYTRPLSLTHTHRALGGSGEGRWGRPWPVSAGTAVDVSSSLTHTPVTHHVCYNTQGPGRTPAWSHTQGSVC
jgi:hypothetical protein